MKTYAIRRAILRVLRDYNAVPVRAVDLIDCSPEPTLQAATTEEVKAEWSNLGLMKYIVPVEGFSGEYCKITERGLQQLSIEFERDPYIWGPTAAKTKG